jgi:hypothetical protein
MGLSKEKSTVNTKFEDILDILDILGSIPENGHDMQLNVFHKEDDGSLRRCSVTEIPKDERAKIASDALITTVKRLNDFVEGRDPRKSSRH